MLALWNAQEGQGWDGLVYLLLGLAWLIAQVFSMLTKKLGRRGPSRTSPGDAPADGPERNESPHRRSSADKTPEGDSGSLPGTLRQFLEQWGNPPSESPPAPPPVPAGKDRQTPAYTPPPPPVTEASRAMSRRRGKKRSSLPVRPLAPEKIDPDSSWKEAMTSGTSVSVGAVPSLREIPWVQTALAPARGTFPASAQHGFAARKAVEGRVSRERVRDALVWKMLLETPRALVPPGHDVIGLNPER